MSGSLGIVPAAAKPLPLEEMAADPALAVACVLLVGVSIAWVAVTRLLLRRQRESAADRWAGESEKRRLRELWTFPP